MLTHLQNMSWTLIYSFTGQICFIWLISQSTQTALLKAQYGPITFISIKKLAIISLSYILLCPSYPKKISFLPTNLFKTVIFPSANIAHTVRWWLLLTPPLSSFIYDAGVTVLTVAAASICTDILWCKFSPKNLGTSHTFTKLANTDAPHFNSLLMLE